MLINDKNLELINKIFIKDQNAPIHLSQNIYFEYLLNLYEPWLNLKDKYKLLIKDVSSFDTLDKWYSDKNEKMDNIKKYINSSKALKKLIDPDFISQYYIENNQYSKNNVFNAENINKKLVSIDMKKGNWQMWSLLELSDAKSYEEFLLKFNASEYQLTSKVLRQVLFGEIEPKKIQVMEKYFSFNLAKELEKNNYKILTCTADEVILDLKNNQNVNEIKNIINEINLGIQWRVEEWSLEMLNEEKNWIIQKNKETNEVKYRNVPKHFMPQVYKKINNIEINDFDLTFEYEGQIANFKSPLFIKEPKLKTKLGM